MIDLHPQYIKNAKGKKTHVVLTASEFEQVIELLEDLEDIEAYKKVKEEENENEFVSLKDYIKMRETELVEI